MTIELKAHQIVAVDSLLSNKRLILADVPGLGKTYPAIVAAFALPAPRLFVVPSYLQYNWYKAIIDMTNEKISMEYTIGSALARCYQIHNGASYVACLITTYEHLRLHADLFRQYQWSVVVFDEAHKLRGRGYKEQIIGEDGTVSVKHHERSMQAEAAYKLKYDAIFMLTGTPQVKDLGDWFALLSMIDRKTFSSYWQFVNQYARIKATPWGNKVGKVKDRAVFKQLITPYILRRDYKDVGIDMPDAVEEEIYIYPPSEFMQKYRSVRNSYRIEQSDGSTRYLLSAGALQSQLYKLVSNLREKLDALRAFCKDNREHQIVIWCWRRDTVDAIIKHLTTDESWGVFRVTGNTPQADRRHTIEQFKSTKNGILVATIASIGLGENIQTAHLSVFYEKSYLPSDNEQAIARLRRLGQTQTVIVKHLMVESTVDTATHRAQSKRGEEIDSIFYDEIYKD